MTDKKQTEEQIHYEKKKAWEDENFRSLLKVQWGRAFLWSILKDCYVFSQTIVFDSPDRSAFNEGRRSYGNKVFDRIMELDPDALVAMQKAARKEDRELKEAIMKDLQYKESQGDLNDGE